MTDVPELDATRPAALLAACPVYAPSPFGVLRMGGHDMLVKDETDRMNLGAFKAVGGVYAVARLIEGHLNREVAPQEFTSDAVRAAAADLTFICASAGNHGLSVAAGARLFGARAQIVLSDTVDESFAQRLRAKGADVIRAGATYEESVAAAVRIAADTGAIHLADGSWPGYTEAPLRVMEGYTIIAEEMRATLEASGDWPDHVYLQAGVGGLAAAMAQMIRRNWAQQPRITVVEPEAAPCLRDSIAAGEILTVAGPVSEMGRLDCKTPSMLAYHILGACADDYVTVSEAEAWAAVETAGQAGVATTPSGAAGLAAALRTQASAEPDQRPLVILSEGVFDGA